MKIVLLLLVVVTVAQAFRQQSVGIKGTLLCGKVPLKDTQVKLWNKNKLGTDDQLAAAKTDANGKFELQGGVGSMFGMNVHFKVYHDCDDGAVPCQRKVDMGIPSQYVTRTEKVDKWFEAGTINMEFKFPDEERSCIN
ncbi:unnamed protein product [Bursaphelenchus okinawaensis]|uniref:Uncharacterized protein n=1 Tax=Bursaphelenchus okinawaensis TaxID=465554 RepID=A0A811LND3_9BILA|nr:unnamed protein product [Bursaphelenchus okinawaensis]CAG9126154.1 unnamed protein product [Bursaphelenchus okinawaensis]